jgi:hypothetical protein
MREIKIIDVKVVGKYKRMKCVECLKIFHISLGGKGNSKQKNVRPRHCITCSPKCSKLHSKKIQKKSAYNRYIKKRNKLREESK